MSGPGGQVGPPVAWVDATLRDLAPLPWGTAVDADDLAAAAEALAPAGAAVLEALDPRCARAAVEARSESPWDRLRAIVREAGAVPVGVVAGARNLWGDVPVAPEMVRSFVLCAVEGGARRVRGTDPWNDPEALGVLAEACAEAGVEFVPTLIVGPAPDPGDPCWVHEARELAALPGCRTLCLSDGAGHLSPAALGELVRAVAAATGRAVEVQVQAPGGLAPLAATAAVAAGAAAVQASAGPVALVAARPSAETIRAALIGGPRQLTADPAELDRAARTVAPMLPADRLRQAAAGVFGPAVALPPALEAGLMARLGRVGLSRLLFAVAEESARVASDVGAATLGYPLGQAIVAQAARHAIDDERWGGIEPELVPVVLGRVGRARGPVAEEAIAAAVAADPEAGRGEAPLAPLAPPPGLSEEDRVLYGLFGEAAARIVERRRSLRSEAEEAPAGHGIDRELLESMVEAIDRAGDAELSVEVAGARVTVRRTAPATPAAGAGAPAAAPAPDEDEGLVRVESPMVGTFYRSPAPDQPPFVEVGDRVAAGQALCLIEAMKLFNEIVADQAGTVRRIAIENEAPAEFGQLLFLIEP